MSGPAGPSGSAGPRKTRIVAIHGGASNSNIMKFQTGPLRKILGNDAEWLFPEGQEPWKPLSEISDQELASVSQDAALSIYYAERSPFEVRLAQGKPFVSWFKIVKGEGDEGPVAQPASIDKAITWLTDYIAKESPIDVVVTFSQGNIVCNAMLARLLAAGEEVPWKLTIAFSPTCLPTAQMVEWAALGRPYPQAAFVVTSPLDPMYEFVKHHEDLMYEDVVFLEHQDGLGFPVRPPVSTEIYARLASEIRARCDLAAPVEPTLQERRRDWQARLAKWRASDQQNAAERADGGHPPAGAVGSAAEGAAAGATVVKDVSDDEDSEPAKDEPPEVEAVTIETLVQLLHEKLCIIADIENRRKSLPGMVKEDISFVTLRMVPAQARKSLKKLREGGVRLVAVSRSGEECQEYCTVLISKFEFQAEQLCVLEGGFRSWDAWELEHPEAGSDLRVAYGLPPLKATVVESVAAEALAELLQLKACIVADVRDPEELRRRAFPGAVKDVGLQALTRRPHQVKRKLAALKEDGRPLVAISGTGLRCRRYCALLVDEFGFDRDKVCWLEGGLCRWEDWEQEHRDESDEIRRLHDLPPSRPRELEEGRAAKQREHSLDILT